MYLGGHLADKASAASGCVFNTVAIAVRTALKNKTARRVVVVCWDARHSLPIQDEFASDPNVVVISLHRSNDTLSESVSQTGSDSAQGSNINIPFSSTGMVVIVISQRLK